MTREMSADIVAALQVRGLTIAVAESLTGGLLAAALVAVPGASAVVRGGVVAYATELKATLLGVRLELLREFGPVHPEVARQMATGVRSLLTVAGVPADVGIATTGVAGPGFQNEHPPGTAFVGMAIGAETRVLSLTLSGSREAIRLAVVSEALAALALWLGVSSVEPRECFGFPSR